MKWKELNGRRDQRKSKKQWEERINQSAYFAWFWVPSVDSKYSFTDSTITNNHVSRSNITEINMFVDNE